MAQLDVQKVVKDLEDKGIDSATVEKVSRTIENLKPETFDKAVFFLGLVTLLLAIGSILLAGFAKTVPDALWGALGTGIGGLAGIFMGKK